MEYRTAGVVAAVLITIGCRTPQTATQSKVADPEPTAQTYRQIGGRSLQAFVFTPERRELTVASPAILLFHGGGWVAGSPDWVFPAARRFAALGLVAIPIEYRLATDSTTPLDTLGDACAAFQWARAHAT